MKRIAAILLLSLMVFNLAGYRWLFSAIEKKVTANLEQRISSGKYSDEQLVEIRIPLNMPYYTDKDYENVYGETDFNGEHYRYVKRKVSGNTLYLLCLPNKEKTSIANAKNEFTKAVNDIPGNKPGSQQKNNFIKLLTSEFQVNEIPVHENGFLMASLSYFTRNTEAKDLFNPLTEAQPPEA
ncbi:MAG TPA: hypothetical protein VFT15_07435 [Chitinophagaceae bacterium]|nr:hypothetical protein [Chitinophagaceae bacterium]